MRFAIANNKRSAPSPGLAGSCPSCNRPVIAKCGDQRVHHWAHIGKRTCDHWWEPETEWHRSWKMHFPEEWQEIILTDQTGEKHIADLRTDHGLTIEFQHSHLRSEERAARENFYGDMVWVVNGLRLSRDLPRFEKGALDFRRLAKGVYVHHFPSELFPCNWISSKAPVYFDFGNIPSPPGTQTHTGRSLWCLLPRHSRPHAVVLSVRREDFIRLALEQSKRLQFQSTATRIEELLETARRARMIRHYQMLARQKAASRPMRHCWRRSPTRAGSSAKTRRRKSGG